LLVHWLLTLLFSNQFGGFSPLSMAVPLALLSIFGVGKGVLACGVKKPSQIHKFWPVELQCLDCGAPVAVRPMMRSKRASQMKCSCQRCVRG
jgi:hypothetical protein